MAVILPLRAWRYADYLTPLLEELTAPLFDVVSSQQREKLYQNPLNSIHLSVPKGPDPAENASKTLQEWKDKGILKQDLIPGIYVYYQYFRLPGELKERCRKGFIIQIKAYDWEEKQILRHEDTIVSAVNDRVDLLQSSKIQASPTHGLYEDPEFELEPFLDAAIASPLYELEDYQGVREKLGVIHDVTVIRKILAFVQNKKVILADGHHRLEGAIAYKQSQKGKEPNQKWKAHEYHLMYLTNAWAQDLKILPTHRLYEDEKLDPKELLIKLQDWFEVKKIAEPEELENFVFHQPRTFGFILGEETFFLKMKDQMFNSLQLKLPNELKQLDLVALHEVLFHQILGLNKEEQRKSSQLKYERNFSRCVQEVRSQKATFAVITRELQMEQVLKVCQSGYVMPQKSTYFYPKALGGLLFASVDPKDFNYNYDTFFDPTKG